MEEDTRVYAGNRISEMMIENLMRTFCGRARQRPADRANLRIQSPGMGNPYPANL